MHVTTCSGYLCPNNHDHHYKDILRKGVPPPLERDCGQWCSAFTYLDKSLPMARFTHPGYDSHVAFIYDASPEVWQKMMCLSVADSSTTTRSCCACYEERFCPFAPGSPISRSNDSGYCHQGACTESDEVCRQLAAGCGFSVWSISNDDAWKDGWCSEEVIASGQCDLCTQPAWCDDGGNSDFGYNSSIKGPQAWWGEFGYNDGRDNVGKINDMRIPFFGAKQCKWKRSQKEQFIDTVRLTCSQYQNEGYSTSEPGIWNEVTMYYGPDDTEAEALMWRNLLGVALLRDGPEESMDTERVRRLKDHFEAQGHEIPFFALSMEPWGSLEEWDFDHDIDITAEPFNLQPFHD